MTVYRTVFDVTEAGWQTWHLPALATACLVAGFLALRSKKIRPMPAIVFTVIAFIFTVVSVVIFFGEYYAIRSGINHGRQKIVEGPVKNFRKTTGKDASDSFCIDEDCYTYSAKAITMGFHKTADAGGPITRDGLQARVTSIPVPGASGSRNVIIKLDVEEGATK